MDKQSRQRHFSAALRPLAAAMSLAVPPYLANDPDYLLISIYERLAGDAEFLAWLRERFKGAAGAIPTTAPDAPANVVGKYIAPADSEPEPEPAPRDSPGVGTRLL